MNAIRSGLYSAHVEGEGLMVYDFRVYDLRVSGLGLGCYEFRVLGC